VVENVRERLEPNGSPVRDQFDKEKMYFVRQAAGVAPVLFGAPPTTFAVDRFEQQPGV